MKCGALPPHSPGHLLIVLFTVRLARGVHRCPYVKCYPDRLAHLSIALPLAKGRRRMFGTPPKRFLRYHRGIFPQRPSDGTEGTRMTLAPTAANRNQDDAVAWDARKTFRGYEPAWGFSEWPGASSARRCSHRANSPWRTWPCVSNWPSGVGNALVRAGVAAITCSGFAWRSCGRAAVRRWRCARSPLHSCRTPPHRPIGLGSSGPARQGLIILLQRPPCVCDHVVKRRPTRRALSGEMHKSRGTLHRVRQPVCRERSQPDRPRSRRSLGRGPSSVPVSGEDSTDMIPSFGSETRREFLYWFQLSNGQHYGK